MRAVSSYGETRVPTPLPSASLTLRPDQVRERLEVSCELPGAVAALEVLQRFSGRLVELLRPLDATVALVHVTPSREGAGKLVSAGTSTAARLLVTAPLAESHDAWARAQRVVQLDELLRAAQQEARKLKPVVELRRELPSCVVADPEALRGRLVARLLAHARLLGKDVKLTGLRFDAPIAQHPRGLDEVELTLTFDGSAELQLS